MNFDAIPIGKSVRFAKTVSESDVYLFAGITGDFASNHTNEAYMRETSFGGRIAHGALLVGYTSRASTMMVDALAGVVDQYLPVALGFDRIRFLKPVLIGDTITVIYEISATDPARMCTTAKIEIYNQVNDQVLAADHIMKWLPLHAAT